LSAFAWVRGALAAAVAVSVRVVRAAGLRLRDFEAVRLRDDDAVPRVRDFAAVLARGFDFVFGLAVPPAGCVDAADLAGVVELAGVGAVGDSGGFVSDCFWAVSVAMLGSSVSGAWLR
jgi:hypothetical protein